MALLVTFGLANVTAVIPITPSGLGIVDAVYIPLLVGFGLTRSNAALGVASYRLMQVFLPILVGACFYTSLRYGPWSIERRDRLTRLRVLAQGYREDGESKVDFLMRAWPKPPSEQTSGRGAAAGDDAAPTDGPAPPRPTATARVTRPGRSPATVRRARGRRPRVRG